MYWQYGGLSWREVDILGGAVGSLGHIPAGLGILRSLSYGSQTPT